jgi:hypothetical protein
MVRRAKLGVLSAVVALALAGCGGGGGGGGSSSSSSSSGAGAASLSGVAAMGAGLVGTVTVTDSNLAVRSVSTDSSGNYYINVDGLAAPFVLQIHATVGSRTYDYYAPATSDDIGGSINITPLSDLILANLATDIAANCRTSNACIAALSNARISSAVSNLATMLQPTLTSLGIAASTDLLRAPMTAGSHTGIDALLDVLNVNLDTATKVATITNIVSGASVTNNVGTGSTSGTLDAGSTTDTSAAGMVAAVKARIAEIDAIIASSADVATKSSQLQAFCTADFLFSGANCAEYMAFGASSGMPMGPYVERFGRFDATATDGVDSATAMDNQHVGAITSDDTRDVLLWRLNATDGKYYVAGNQNTGRYSLWASQQWDANTGTGSSFIGTDVKPVAANGTTMLADSALITGPGLASTVHLTQVVGNPYLMVDYGIGNYGNWILESDYTLSDVQTGVLAKSPYTLTLRLSGGTVATYKRTLKVAPLASSALTESMFAYVTNPPTVANCQSGANWYPSYVKRGLSITETRVECSDGSSTTSNSYQDGDTTMLAMPTLATATQVTVYISGMDDTTGLHFQWKKTFN